MTKLHVGLTPINYLGHDISTHYKQEKLLFTLHALCLMFNYNHGG